MLPVSRCGRNSLMLVGNAHITGLLLVKVLSYVDFFKVIGIGFIVARIPY